VYIEEAAVEGHKDVEGAVVEGQEGVEGVIVEGQESVERAVVEGQESEYLGPRSKPKKVQNLAKMSLTNNRIS